MDWIDQLARFLEAAFATLWQTSARASVLIVLALGLIFFWRKVTPGWRLFLAAAIFVRLLVPFAPESRWSIFNVFESGSENFEVGRENPILGREIFRSDPVAVRTNPVAVRTDPVGSEFSISWSAVAGGVWLVGMLGFFGVAFVRQRRLTRSMRRISLGEEFEVCRRILGFRGKSAPGVFESNLVGSPALVGWLRPRVVVPCGFVRIFTAAQRRHMLLHELAHLKRGDGFWNGLAFVVSALHWPNPLVWVVARRFRQDLELACDERVLGVLEDRADYGNTLLRVAEKISTGGSREPETVLAMPFLKLKSSHLKRRIEMIAKTNKTTNLWTVAAMGGVVALLCVATFTGAKADDEKGEKLTEAEVKRLLETAEYLEKIGLRNEAKIYRDKVNGKGEDAGKPEREERVQREREERKLTAAEVKQLLATAESLEKIGLRNEARIYRDKANGRGGDGGAGRDVEREGGDRGRDRPVVRDGERDGELGALILPEVKGENATSNFLMFLQEDPRFRDILEMPEYHELMLLEIERANDVLN